MSLVARLLRAVGALVVTVGISAGVPWGLLTYVGNPIPKHLPSTSQASEWLTGGHFDIHTALAVIVHILWGCWAVFVAQVLVQVPGIGADVVRVLRRREPSRRDAIGGPGGALVRTLVAAFTIALIAPRSAVPQAAAKASGFVHAAQARPAASAPALPGSRQATHTVERGESLWGIAEAELGGGAMWPSLYAANVGHAQPDGQSLTDPGLIEPGWTLTVPKLDATPPVAVAKTGQAGVNGAVTLPIPVPAASPASQAVPRPAAPGYGPTSQLTPQPRAVEQSVAPRDRQGVQLPTGGFVGMGLAACLAAAIAACHLLNRHRARLGAGESACVPAPTEPAGTLQRAHLVALAPPGVGYFQDEADLDDPYPAAGEVPEDSGMLPGAAAAAPWPTITEPAPHQAVPGAAADCTPGLDEQLAALDAPTDLHIGVRAGIPIPLGAATEGGLSITGDGGESVARALLLAALAAGGPGPLRKAAAVYTTSDMIQRLLGSDHPCADPDRLTECEDLPRLLDLLELDIAERNAALADYEYADAAQLRRFEPSAAFWPIVVLIDGEHPRLMQAVGLAHRVDIHIVALNALLLGVSAVVEVSGLTSAVGAHGAALDGMRAFQLSAEEASTLILQLNAARPETASAPAEPFTDSPVLDGAPPAAGEPAPVVSLPPITSTTTITRAVAPPGMVRVDFLGPLVVTVADRDCSGGFQKSARTLMTRMVIEPHGVSRETLLRDLWQNPKRPGNPNTLHNLTRRLRVAFEESAGRKDAFVIEDKASKLLRLNPAVIVTDLDAFDDLRRRADTAKDAEQQIGLYEAAIGLYRGPLAFGIDSADWLLPHRMDRQRDYADAATKLARLYGATDAERTLAMLDAVLKRDPLNEDLYRRIMRVQAKLQRPDAVNRTLQLLEARCEELQTTPDSTTYELAKSLTRARAA